jgi:hypothetical protein
MSTKTRLMTKRAARQMLIIKKRKRSEFLDPNNIKQLIIHILKNEKPVQHAVPALFRFYQEGTMKNCCFSWFPLEISCPERGKIT